MKLFKKDLAKKAFEKIQKIRQKKDLLKKDFKRKHLEKTVIRQRVRTGVPFMFTFANALFGFLSIIKTIEGNFTAAALCIVAAVIMDGCDGRLARYFKTTGQLGSELDSLCDAISFCLAPAVLLYSWYLHNFDHIGLFSVALVLYLCAGLLRLARFNTLTHDQSTFYLGLPSTIAAFFLAALIGYDMMLSHHFFHSLLTRKVMVGITTFLALLMISTIRFPVFKKISFKGFSIQFFARLILLLTLIGWCVYHGYPVLVLIIGGYIIAAVVSGVARFLR